MPKYKILSSNALKLIAIITMTVDHIAWAMFDGYPTEPLPFIVIGTVLRHFALWQ